MKPFRERNPMVIGAVGLAVVAALLVASFNIQSIPPFNRGTTYRAAFSEAGGLKPGDDVRIAGVQVGTVKDVELAGDHVDVVMKVDRGTRFGTETTASVRIRTILGQKFVMLEPKGPGRQSPRQEIPLDRTVSAYDVVDAFSDLTRTTERIDTGQLATALDTISSTFKNSPPDVRAAVDGLSRLSRTVASRDDQLRQLLSRAKDVTGTVASRDAQLQSLVEDGDLLLQEVAARRDAIHQLLVSTSALSQQLTGLVRDNQAQLAPVLARLHDVLAVLQANQDNLDRSIAAMAPFVRVFANALGNGRWFDTYVQNLVAPVPSVPSLGSGR